MLESLRFTLTENYRETQITKIRQLNNNLSKLVPGVVSLRNGFGGSNRSVPAIGSRVNAAQMQVFQRVREVARALHRGLESECDVSQQEHWTL